MRTSTIEILLPFFNHRYLRGAIESVLAQSDKEWRLVCVDDHSPENGAREWLSSLGDPRVTYLRNDRNLGVAGNFANALDLVTAPWFVMLGEDDELQADYVSTLRRAVERYDDVDAIQPGVEVIDESGFIVRPMADLVKQVLRPRATSGRVLHGEKLAESLTRGDWAYFPSILWRTETVRRIGFDTRFEIALDWALLLSIASTQGSIAVIDDVVFRYRRHNTSASQILSSQVMKFQQEITLLNTFAGRFQRLGWYRAERIASRRSIQRLSVAFAAASTVLSGDIQTATRLARLIW